MNERIQEIAFQASENHDYHPEFAKKFAQSIIKECVEKIINEKSRTPGKSDYMHGYRDMADCAVFMIKKHFGVEE